MKGVNGILLGSLFLFVIASMFVVSAGNIVHIQTNVLSNDSYIYFEVNQSDEFVDLGTIAKGESSDEKTIHVTNKGTEDITIYPTLPSSYKGNVFKRLMFREQKSDSSGRKHIAEPVGQWNMNITKPTASENITGNRDQFYVLLNLTDYTEPIYAQNQKVDVIIIAVPEGLD
jgi:hypothetical protein